MPSMTITIPAEKYDDFKKYFLLAHPNSTEMSDGAWIRACIKRMVRTTCLRGLQKEHEQTMPTVIEDSIVEVS
jgi:hypothetical protein